MASFLIFLALLFILFLLARVLHKELSSLFFRLTNSKKTTITLMAFLFFPGTLIHELAHFLSARLLFVHTGKMTLVPKISGDHVALGSVEIGKTDPFRRLLIGGAPFLIGTSLILLTLYLSEYYSLWGEFWYSILIIYILFELGNTMFSSRKDMEGALLVLLFISILSIILYFLGFQLLNAVRALFDDEQLRQSFTQGSLYLLYPLGINLICIVVLKLLQRVRR